MRRARRQPAYDNLNSCYDADALLLFSEIDPVQNAAVDAAAGAIAGATPSTIDYNPTYFLINGEPYDKTTPAAGGCRPGRRGTASSCASSTPGCAPTRRPSSASTWGWSRRTATSTPDVTKQQSAALLPAGKTLDALVAMPAADATYPLFDRMLDLTNDNQPDGGMLAYLQVGTGSAPPPPPTTYAVNDTYPVTEDTAARPRRGPACSPTTSGFRARRWRS